MRAPIPSSSAPSLPRVTLREPYERPLVQGQEVDFLTDAQYDVIQTLLEAGPQGLKKDDLDYKSGHPDARKILKRLHDSSPLWQSVISLPKRKGLRYRLEWEVTSCIHESPPPSPYSSMATGSPLK